MVRVKRAEGEEGGRSGSGSGMTCYSKTIFLKVAMATQYMTESSYPQMQFSIVVDDVDGEEVEETPEEVDEAQEALEGATCMCGASHERRGSREPADAQMCSERIRQIQVEAESRKNEFAKLLEEHAQVVLRVKQMEQREQQASELQHQHRQARHQQRQARAQKLLQQQQASSGSSEHPYDNA